MKFGFEPVKAETITCSRKVNEEDRFSINLGKLSRTENQMARNMLNAIAEADPEKLKHIEEFMKACLGIE